MDFVISIESEANMNFNSGQIWQQICKAPTCKPTCKERGWGRQRCMQHWMQRKTRLQSSYLPYTRAFQLTTLQISIPIGWLQSLALHSTHYYKLFFLNCCLYNIQPLKHDFQLLKSSFLKPITQAYYKPLLHQTSDLGFDTITKYSIKTY